MGERGLPDDLLGRPFTVREAAGRGLRASDLRGVGLHRPTRGVRTASEPMSVHDRAAAYLPAMPRDASYSHVTAAQLLRLPLPPALEGQVDLDVMRPSSVSQVRRAGCIGHRGTESRLSVVVRGLRVVGPVDTWCDLGEVTARGLTLDDLVVVGDAVATRMDAARPGPAARGGSPDDREGVDAPRGAAALAACLDARTRPRGKAMLSEALGLIRSGSASPMETRARLMFHRAGFPEPELNALVSFDDGGWLLEGDLVWRDHRVIGEYQGRDHASIARRSYDASRAGLAYDEGWTLLELYAEDVFRAPRRRATLRRFATAMSLDPAALHIE